MTTLVCKKHGIPLEDFGSGGWKEMRCPKCYVEYYSPEAANARTKATAARRKRAKLRRMAMKP